MGRALEVGQIVDQGLLGESCQELTFAHTPVGCFYLGNVPA